MCKLRCCGLNRRVRLINPTSLRVNRHKDHPRTIFKQFQDFDEMPRINSAVRTGVDDHNLAEPAGGNPRFDSAKDRFRLSTDTGINNRVGERRLNRIGVT